MNYCGPHHLDPAPSPANRIPDTPTRPFRYRTLLPGIRYAWGVGLWPLKSQAVVDAAERITASAVASTPGEPVAWGSLSTTPGWASLAGGVSRAEALSVPAVSRAVDLLVTTAASLPWSRLNSRGQVIDLGWLEQPEPNRSRWATLVDTGRDLILHGAAYWVVNGAGYDMNGRMRVEDDYRAGRVSTLRRTDAWGRGADGYPIVGGLEYAPWDRVGRVGNPLNPTELEWVTYNGRFYTPGDVIAFVGWHDGILTHGADIIRTALALENAARNYAQTPLPSQIVRNTSNYELSDAEVAELLAAVKKSRTNSSVGYLNAGAELQTVGWNSRDLQLTEGRMFANAQIANLLGVPQHLIAGSNPSGSSQTYANVSQENRGFIDYGLKPLLSSIESRLSLTDPSESVRRGYADKLENTVRFLPESARAAVTPRGQSVKFELDALLRGNPLERAQLYAQLIPLGVLTPDEAREWEDLVPDPNAAVPAVDLDPLDPSESE